MNLDVFKPIKIYLKTRNYDTTNWTFKLVCRFNVGILFMFVILMTANQIFGKPIDCGEDIGKVKKESIENFCWIMGLYVQEGFTGVLNNKTAHLGYMVTGRTSGERIYLRFYQWLVLVYLIMAALYSFPAQIWKHWEGSRIKSLCDGLGDALFEKNWTKERRSELIAYFMWPHVRSIHAFYALKFFICQIILLLVSIFNIWMVDTILSGFWNQYYHAMTALYPFDYDGFVEHTAKIFPRMAKCDFYNYGSSGSLQKLDSLCLLPLNILNEKIFAFLFFWLLLMFVVTALSVMWSLIIGCCSCLRILVLRAQTHDISFEQLRQATHNGSLGDFFVLHLLGKNMNAYVFKDLLIELGSYKNRSKNDEEQKHDLPTIDKEQKHGLTTIDEEEEDNRCKYHKQQEKVVKRQEKVVKRIMIAA